MSLCAFFFRLGLYYFLQILKGLHNQQKIKTYCKLFSCHLLQIYSDRSLLWIIKALGHLGGSSWVTSSLDGRSWHSLIPQSWHLAKGAALVVNEWNTTVLFSCLSVTCSKQTLITKAYLNPLASNPLIVCKYCCSVLKKNVLVRSNLSTSCWLLDCSSILFPEPSVY